MAAGYDTAARHIHLYYIQMQDIILDLLPGGEEADFLLVDAGAGSGRLAERFLERFVGARALLVDRSEAFLALARRRLEPHGNRAAFHLARLEDDWTARLARPPRAIVSMSAVHHLDSDQKQDFYRRCYEALEPGGVLINGDEVRATNDMAYLEQLKTWVAHMQRVMDLGLVPDAMCQALRDWESRNVGRFDRPCTSGDDCHETVDAQLVYFTACGFAEVDMPWQKEMWAILRGRK